MSYAAKETGIYTGNPIELYRFADAADADLALYTSGDVETVYSGKTYTPYTISRGNVRLATDLNSDKLMLRVPRDNAVAALFISYSPQDSVWLTIYRLHRDDGNAITIWKGRVRGASWQGSQATLECEPLSGLLKRYCLRASFQALCNHQLGDARCTVDFDDTNADGMPFSIRADLIGAVTIGAVTGLVYQSDDLKDLAGGGGYKDTWFTGGFAVDLVTGERRLIVVHDGTTGNITLWQAFSGVGVGDEIDVYAGCPRSADACVERFDNLVNFGGFPAMPAVNPFTHAQRRSNFRSR